MVDPAEHNFNLYHGQTLAYPFTVWNDEEQTSPFVFTGYTVAAQARSSYTSASAVNLNPTITTNTVYLNLTPTQAQTLLVPANNLSAKFYYDVEITKTSDSTKWTMVRGVITVYPEVTRI